MSKAIIPAGTEKVVEAFHFVPGRTAGNLLFISGQLGTHNRVLADGLEAQIDAAFANIMTDARKAGRSKVVDQPANYHNGAAGFSFSDGHAEIRRWLGAKISQAKVIFTATGNYISLGGVIPASDPKSLLDVGWMADNTTVSTQ